MTVSLYEKFHWSYKGQGNTVINTPRLKVTEIQEEICYDETNNKNDYDFRPEKKKRKEQFSGFK